MKLVRVLNTCLITRSITVILAVLLKSRPVRVFLFCPFVAFMRSHRSPANDLFWDELMK